MSGRSQLLVLRLKTHDSVASAEKTRDGSTTYVDVQLTEGATTNEIAPLLDDGFSFQDAPSEFDIRIIDENQPSIGVVRT